MNRTKSYSVAAILQFLMSVSGVALTLAFLPRGADALDQVSDSPPYFVIITGFAFALLGLISAYGVWRNQKWGVILTILLRAIDSLMALPGVLFAPTTFWRISAITGILLSAVIIYLLLRREPVLATA